MKFFIKTIILWPKDVKKKKREIHFEPDKVNIITGQSQTGKSSIIPIIDYCLGASKCRIPVGIIREKTEWFGIVVQLEDMQWLVARKEPGMVSNNSDLYFIKGIDIKIPEFIKLKESNVNVLKDNLNRIAQLTNLSFDYDGGKTGFSERPSFRDLSAFQFQPQHIIANPNILFYNTDSYEHRERLKILFSLILGAIDTQYIELRHRLKNEKQTYEKKNQELEIKKQAIETWKNDITAKYNKAQEYGLIEYDKLSDTRNSDYIIAELEKIINKDYNKVLIKIPTGATERLTQEILKLQQEENLQASLLEDNRRKLQKIKSVSHSSDLLNYELDFQSQRISPFEWFEKEFESKKELKCPFCGSNHNSAEKEINKFREIIKDLKSDTKQYKQIPDLLSKEIENLGNEILNTEDTLNKIRERKVTLEGESEELNKQSQTMNDIFRFIGGLEQTLKNISNTSIDSLLFKEVQKLAESIQNLESQLSKYDVSKKKKNALIRISNIMSVYAQFIGIEKPNDPINLDIESLILKISNTNNREDFLWEIGSGANWMGYHIICMLALHEYFIFQDKSPVPSFIIFDQPSQVYFPEIWPGDPNKSKRIHKQAISNIGDIDYSKDIEDTKKIFLTISKCFNKLNGNLQIIILDHADEVTWQGIDGCAQRSQA